MDRKKYTDIRTKAILTFGIVMLTISLFTAIFGFITSKHELDHATAISTGKVVREGTRTYDDGDTARVVYISYVLDGEEWLVNYPSDDVQVGDEVNVHYNPDNTEEKYIEGFEDNPMRYLGLGLIGSLAGIGAIVIFILLKRNPNLNRAVDMVDRQVR